MTVNKTDLPGTHAFAGSSIFKESFPMCIALFGANNATRVSSHLIKTKVSGGIFHKYY